MKICKECNLEKENIEFYKNRGKLINFCKKCKNKKGLEYQKRYRKLNVEKVKEWNKIGKLKKNTDPLKKAKIKEQKKLSNNRNYIHILWKRTKDRALKRGFEFTLLENEIIIPENCPILEIPLFPGDLKNYKNSPTIDRIDNSKGYTKSNVKIISMLANSMKNSATDAELKTFSKNILNYINDKDDIV